MKKQLFLAALVSLAGSMPAADLLWQNDLNTESELRKFTRHSSNWDLSGGVNGSSCLKFHNDKPEGYPPSATLDPNLFKGKTVIISAMIKAKDLQVPANRYWGPKVCLYYKTASGKEQFAECPKSYGTYNWKPVSLKVKLPSDIEKIRLLAGLQRCAGTFWIDGISIQEYVPGKTYENYFVTGWTEKMRFTSPPSRCIFISGCWTGKYLPQARSGSSSPPMTEEIRAMTPPFRQMNLCIWSHPCPFPDS